MPKHRKPGKLEEYRAQLRAQFDRGWAKTRLAQLDAEKAPRPESANTGSPVNPKENSG